MFRSAFMSVRSRPSNPLTLIQRFDASKRCQCRGYAKSSGQKNERVNGHELLKEARSSSNSSSRSPLTYAIPAALLGVVGLGAFIRHNDEKRSINKGEGVKKGVNVKGPVIGGPFTLINTNRQTVTEKDLSGNWVLLYFGYTSSPDVGPAEVQKIAKAMDILESKQSVKLLPIFVTIDPQRDSPAQLHAYLREFDSRIVGLTGPVNSIRQIAQEYRVFFKRVEETGNDYLVESSHNMYLMSPNMEIVKCFGTEYSADELADAIVNEVKRSES